jgi:uncharacterized repeat protein (TIGR02543 family)
VDPITEDEDISVNAPSPAPEREGYTFGGWFTSTAFDDEFEFPYEMGADYTLYAKWTVDQYTVTFDIGDCPGAAPDNQTVDYGSYATEPDPSIVGYYVFGWTTDDGTPFNFANTPITGDITLHADWGFILAFNSQDGSAVDEMYVRSGEVITRPADPVWEGEGTYVFAGWYTTPTCDDDTEFELWGSDIRNNYTLYAKWTEVRQYTLTFVTGEGGSAVPSITEAEGTVVTAPDDPVWTGEGNYVFAGWFTSDTYDESTRVSWPYTITGDNTFYAKWDEVPDGGDEP